MLKQINLKITKIRYEGDSIGDDIRIEVQCLDRFVVLNKTIKNGVQIDLNFDIGEFFADQSIYSLPLEVKIIERDIIFNDVGSRQIKLKIDLEATSPQQSVHIMEITERRNFVSTSKAVFEFVLEAIVSNPIGYVSDTGADGWLKVIRSDTKKEIGLPAFLRVRINETKSNREHFTILEGSLSGVDASVVLSSAGRSRFSFKNSQSGPVSLTYSIRKKTLQFKNKIYQATDDPETPWEKGLYDIEIPDFGHRGGINYPESKFAKNWFRIGHSGVRYLHTGRISAGCLTIIETRRWDELYEILVKARKGDNVSIGTLTVIK